MRIMPTILKLDDLKLLLTPEEDPDGYASRAIQQAADILVMGSVISPKTALNKLLRSRLTATYEKLGTDPNRECARRWDNVVATLDLAIEIIMDLIHEGDRLGWV